MRTWEPPELADILVSELLGSFGDNELSPECLDGAQRLLAPHGISIPSEYTSFIEPVTAAKVWSDARVRPHEFPSHTTIALMVRVFLSLPDAWWRCAHFIPVSYYLQILLLSTAAHTPEVDRLGKFG